MEIAEGAVKNNDPVPEVAEEKGGVNNTDKIGGGYYYAHAKRGEDAAPAPVHKPITEGEKASIESYYTPKEGQSAWNTGYHWEEKDLTCWAKTRISELIAISTTIKKGLTLEYKDVVVEGHATMNNRKGKKLVGFELNVCVDWEARLEDSSASFLLKGKVASASLGFQEDIEIAATGLRVHEADMAVVGGSATMETSLKKREVLAKIVNKKGINHVREAMKTFVAELEAK